MRPTCFSATVLLAMTVLLGGLRGAARPDQPLPPTAMPRDHPGPRPKPRSAAEVEAVLAGAPNPPAATRPLRIVLVAGQKDHGKGEHDYPAWQKAWAALFGLADQVAVGTAWEWPAKEEFQKADVLVFYQHGDWTPQRAADVDAFLDRGGGLVYVHWAVDGREDAPGFARRIGLASRGGKIKYRHGPLDLSFNQAAKHPIARKFDRLHLVDESYWMLTGDLPADRVLATAAEDKEPRPLFWTLELARGAGVRVDPRALLLDVRRPALPRAAAARDRLGRPGAGRSLQRPGLARGGRDEVIARRPFEGPIRGRAISP
jgi:Trehalose utilisation